MSGELGAGREERARGRPPSLVGLQSVCGALLRLIRLALLLIGGLLDLRPARATKRVQHVESSVPPVAFESRQLTRASNPQQQSESEVAAAAALERKLKSRIPPVQMSQEIVAGFEEQQVAHELSAKVVEEALQAVIERLEMSAEATGEGQREASGRELDRATTDEQLECSLEDSLAISQLSLTDGGDEIEDEDEDEDDYEAGHSGRQASQMNLRQLKLSAYEDVLVCDRNRHKTSAARHLFNQLAEQKPDSNGAQRAEAKAKASRRTAGSLGSRSSLGAHETNSDDDNNSSSQCSQTDFNYLDELCDGPDQAEDCGTIKLDRRCCSSSSNSSTNFGRTLVCSMSPTGQFNLDSNLQRALNIHEHEHGQPDRDRLGLEPNYPINGDEIRQCREAFRQNRRLIEQAQEEACRKLRHAIEGGAGGLSRSASQLTAASDRSRWAESLGRRSQLPNCSRCQKKLYPIDKLDLDFARATLNIHRNCFKCQVCATLLRLDSYASIDAKLYCPAHVRYVAVSR